MIFRFTPAVREPATAQSAGSFAEPTETNEVAVQRLVIEDHAYLGDLLPSGLDTAGLAAERVGTLRKAGA